MYWLTVFTGLFLTFLLSLFLHIILFYIYKKGIDFKEYLIIFFIGWFFYYFWELSLGIIFHYFVWYELWQYNEKLNSYVFWYSSTWSIYAWCLYSWIFYHVKKIYKLSFLKFIVFWSFFAILMEYLINSISLFIYWEYIFYYLPWDLQHKTTILAVPLYMFAMISFFHINKILESLFKEKMLTIVIFILFLQGIIGSLSIVFHNMT